MAVLALTLVCATSAAGATLGSDCHGQPLGCSEEQRIGLEVEDPLPPPPGDQFQSWETIPGVVRADGSESFRLEVTVSAPVAAVTLSDLAPCLQPLADGADSLRDDGTTGDRVGGDLVYTSVPFRFDPACPINAFFGGDPASPPGLDLLEVGDVHILDLAGATREFLARPAVGLLAADVPPVLGVPLSTDIVATPHLVNVRTDGRVTQHVLRVPGDGLSTLTSSILA